MLIHRITPTEYRFRPHPERHNETYVEYTLLVQAKKTSWHTSSFYDPDACLFTEWPAFIVTSRFSQLNDLHRELHAHHRSESLPEFPPKKWLGNKQDSFLRERMRLLARYFEQLMDLPELQSSPLLQDFCRPRIELHLAIAGYPDIGKMRVLEGFLSYSPKFHHRNLASIENRKASEQDAAPFAFPLDIIVQKKLTRILSIEIVQLSEGVQPEQLRFDGIVFTYSNAIQESYNLVKTLRAASPIPSVIVGLDHQGDPGFASYSAECVGDAFEVFEHLLNTIITSASPYIIEMVRLSNQTNELVDMGFPVSAVNEALEKCRGDREAALHVLLGTSQAQMSSSFNAQTWSRGKAAGLMHIGETTYVNSLLQAYFAIPTLTKAILSFDFQPEEEPDTTRVSVCLIRRLQHLFSYMAISERKAIDPSPVLSFLRDDAGTFHSGKQISISDESDFGEFNMWLVSRIEDGLKAERSQGAGVFLNVDSLRLRDSFRNLSEAEMIDEGIVSRLFFGKAVEELRYKEGNGEGKIVTKETLFAHFLLPTDHSDLMSAWKHSMCSTISDYRTASGHLTTCQLDTWISKLPKAIVFQLAHNGQKKSFRFPTVLNADQFLEENKEMMIELRAQSSTIQRRISMLERKLEKMENYRKSQQSVEKVLKYASGFLTDQRTNSDYTVIEEEQMQAYSPLCLFAVTDESKTQLQSASDLIDAFAAKLNASYASTLAEIKSLKSQLELIFTRPELTHHTYKLHSILVHSGQSSYSTYVYSPDSKTWLKFSDENVWEMPESKVLDESQAYSSYSSTYGLIYLHETLARGWETDSFSGYIPKTLLRQITDENRKIKREYEDQLIGSMFTSIVNTYFDRQKQMLSLANNKSMILFPDLVNFPMFLKVRSEEMLSRWVILDQCVRERDPQRRSLQEIATEPLGVKLWKHMSQCNLVPMSFKLNGTEERRIKTLLKEFEDTYRDATVFEFGLKMMNECHFENACFALLVVLNRQDGVRNEYRKLAGELAEILVLRLTSEITKSLFNLQISEAMQFLDLTCSMLSLSIDPQHLVSKQVMHNLTSSYQWMNDIGKEVCLEEVRVEFKKKIEIAKRGDMDTTLDLSKSVPELESVKQAEARFSGQNWFNGWLPNSLSRRVGEGLQRLRLTTYSEWIEMLNHLQSSNSLVSDAKRDSLEAKAGMRPKLLT